jgi:hypothetical protein
VSDQTAFTTHLTDKQGFRNWCTALYDFEVGNGIEQSGAAAIPTNALSMPGPIIISTSQDLSRTTEPPPLPSGAANASPTSTTATNRATDGRASSGLASVTARFSDTASGDASASGSVQTSTGSNDNGMSGAMGIGIGVGIGLTLLIGSLAAIGYLIWRLKKAKRSGEKNASAVPISSPWSPGSGSDGLQIVNPSQMNTPSTVSGVWHAVSPADAAIPTHELPVHGAVPTSHGASFAELEALKMP